ncbi:MAG: hypothetical protein IPJ55_16255 [Chloracidobacterium sp.]|nr:hypothetical protein [Chloracidobacterium sp.]
MNKEIEKYLSELEAKGYSKDLRRSSERVLNNLQLYLQEAWLIKRWNEAEETHLNSYLVHLQEIHRPEGIILKTNRVEDQTLFPMALHIE